jgi:hypothetical protein
MLLAKVKKLDLHKGLRKDEHQPDLLFSMSPIVAKEGLSITAS